MATLESHLVSSHLRLTQPFSLTLEKSPTGLYNEPCGFFYAHNNKERRNGMKKKQTAVAFVDYEHWFYSYLNKFNMSPNVQEWIDEIEDEYRLKDLYVYGDFNNKTIAPELDKLKKFTKNVVHTASMKDGVDKDFTDFIILDAIYREAANKKSPDVYIIFTGDAHFNLAVQYLKEKKKKVIIYAVRHSLSNRLKSSANSYVEMPRQSQEQQVYVDMIFDSMRRLRSKKKMATYWKTVKSVSEYNKIPKDRIKNALDGLISQKFLYEEEIEYKGKKNKILKADWDKIGK